MSTTPAADSSAYAPVPEPSGRRLFKTGLWFTLGGAVLKFFWWICGEFISSLLGASAGDTTKGEVTLRTTLATLAEFINRNSWEITSVLAWIGAGLLLIEMMRRGSRWRAALAEANGNTKAAAEDRARAIAAAVKAAVEKAEAPLVRQVQDLRLEKDHADYVVKSGVAPIVDAVSKMRELQAHAVRLLRAAESHDTSMTWLRAAQDIHCEASNVLESQHIPSGVRATFKYPTNRSWRNVLSVICAC